MDFFRKHEKFWKVVVVFATLALVASSFIPFFTTF